MVGSGTGQVSTGQDGKCRYINNFYFYSLFFTRVVLPTNTKTQGQLKFGSLARGSVVGLGRGQVNTGQEGKCRYIINLYFYSLFFTRVVLPTKTQGQLKFGGLARGSVVGLGRGQVNTGQDGKYRYIINLYLYSLFFIIVVLPSNTKTRGQLKFGGLS